MPTQGNPLATPDQVAMEDLAMRLYRSKPVKDAMDRWRKTYTADPRASTVSGKTTVDHDLDELSFQACYIAAIDHPDDPKVFWGINMPRHWFGRDVPGSRCGIDNPDSVYRMIAIDEHSSYVVTGHLPATPPVNVSFTVFPVWPGLIDDPSGEFPPALGGVGLKQLDVDPAGSFKLTLSPSPTNGQRNHVQLRPGARALFIRDTMSDWARETPLYLSIQRVAGPPAKSPRDEETLSRLAAKNVEQSARYWSALPAHYYYRTGPNQLSVKENPAFARGGQYTANGNFELKDDEAYVFTLDPLGAGYLGVQLADLYGAALDYAHHTASLTESQMVPNADGTLTYVLSIQDPGVYNWLDPTGLDRGLYMFRYHAYDPDKLTPEAAIRMEKTVKLSKLDSVLPKGTRRVTPEERRQQLAERLAAYNRRLSETPPDF